MYEGEFEFDRNIIYPGDPTATDTRIKEYASYYAIKYDLCKRKNPKVIAEIGVRCGYSAWSFLQACPNVRYVGLDDNNGTHGGKGGEDGSFFKWAGQILSKYNTTLIEADTQKIIDLKDFKDKNEDSYSIVDVDFFHVDGDHTSEGVYHDLSLALEVLSENGMILVDDIAYLKTVREGVNEWLSNMGTMVMNEFISSLRGEMLIWRRFEKGLP